MNNWSHLENRLRSWTPRAPSAKLKHAIFGGSAQTAPHVSVAFGGSWHWLAPVMGCFLLLLVVLNPRDGRLGDWSGADTNQLLATIVSNQNLGAYIMADSHSKQNGVGHDTLEWTNGQRALTGISSPLLFATTNSLLR